VPWKPPRELDPRTGRYGLLTRERCRDRNPERLGSLCAKRSGHLGPHMDWRGESWWTQLPLFSPPTVKP
jgi:hypothetical protein